MALINYLLENLLKERDDINKTTFIKGWVDKMYLDITKQVNDLFGYYFPNEIGTKKDMSARMKKLDTDFVRFHTFNTDPIPVKISRNTPRNTFRGEYVSTNMDDKRTKIKPYIILNFDVLEDLLDKFKQLVASYNHYYDKTFSINKSYLQDARVVFKKINKFIASVESDMKDTLTHELVHFVDDYKYNTSSSNVLVTRDTIANKKLNSVYKKLSMDHNSIMQAVAEIKHDSYYNSGHSEYNAYYLQAVAKFLSYVSTIENDKPKQLELVSNFESFKNTFIRGYMTSFGNFDYDRKVKIVKRIYELFNILKEKFSK